MEKLTRHGHPTLHRRPFPNFIKPALHIRKLIKVGLVPFVSRDPGIGGDVGDGVEIAGEKFSFGEFFIHHAVEAVGFFFVALDGVGDFFFRRAQEVVGLAEHGADAAHLKHQPLENVVKLVPVGR